MPDFKTNQTYIITQPNSNNREKHKRYCAKNEIFHLSSYGNSMDFIFSSNFPKIVDMLQQIIWWNAFISPLDLLFAHYAVIKYFCLFLNDLLLSLHLLIFPISFGMSFFNAIHQFDRWSIRETLLSNDWRFLSWIYSNVFNMKLFIKIRTSMCHLFNIQLKEDIS